MQLDERFKILRGTADSADRPGHCATVVGRGERGDKRGEERNRLEREEKWRGANKGEGRKGVKWS